MFIYGMCCICTLHICICVFHQITLTFRSDYPTWPPDKELIGNPECLSENYMVCSLLRQQHHSTMMPILYLARFIRRQRRTLQAQAASRRSSRPFVSFSPHYPLYAPAQCVTQTFVHMCRACIMRLVHVVGPKIERHTTDFGYTCNFGRCIDYVYLHWPKGSNVGERSWDYWLFIYCNLTRTSASSEFQMHLQNPVDWAERVGRL